MENTSWVSRIRTILLIAWKFAIEHSFVWTVMEGTYQRDWKKGRSEKVTIKIFSLLGGIYQVRQAYTRHRMEIEIREWLAVYNYATRSLDEINGNRRCYFSPEDKMLLMENFHYQKESAFAQEGGSRA